MAVSLLEGVGAAGVDEARVWRVYVRDGGCCTYCGQVLRADEAVLDHDGHPGAEPPEEELCCACRDCHADKGERRTREEYRALRRLHHAHDVLRHLARGAR